MMITLEFSLYELHFISCALAESVRNGVSAGVRDGTRNWSTEVRVALSIQEKISEALPVMVEPTHE